jgi:hypothetical protein
VLYLVFNEGYSALAGDVWMRPALCTEALRLGRVLAGLMPAEREVHGLVALMEIQASRIPARLSPAGLPVPLPEQNRGRWDQLLIRRGFTALLRAERLGGPPGPYVLQAAIAACHARARTAADTEWAQMTLASNRTTRTRLAREDTRQMNTRSCQYQPRCSAALRGGTQDRLRRARQNPRPPAALSRPGDFLDDILVGFKVIVVVSIRNGSRFCISRA